MLLAIDIGNTNITLGVFDEQVLRFTARLATDNKATADQYAIFIKNILEINSCDYAEIEDCIIASVVPGAGSAVRAAVASLFDIVPLELGPGVKTGLNIKIDNPAQLGADLVAGAVGAINVYTLPWIVIDMGTATTLSVIDENATYLGGVIAAGVRLTLKALTENTAALPSVTIKAPKNVIGTNTVDCMQSGLVFGAAAMLDGLIDQISAQLDTAPTVVATGGLSSSVVPHCRHEIIYDENLLLDGLREIYERNK